MNIVIIDDEPGIREVIRISLETEGHDIVEADNGISGLAVIRDSAPDLIVCDICMPEMTGDELFDELRESESDLGVIPFIFLSGEATTSERIKRLNKGADNCFEKPIDLKLLAAHVNSHLSRATRVSDYFKTKLDDIANSLPKTITHDFSVYKSITTNTNGYVDAIISAINQQSKVKNLSITSDTNTDDLETVIVLDELSYIRYCLNSFEKRREIVRSANGEDLSWTLIFLVIQAQLQDLKIYVSDLYVSIPSAKSTINARLNSLIKEDVFTKASDSTDGRRQQIFLTDRFMSELMTHINTNIKLIKQIS